jgi:cytochrome c oxidase cbb3-type subunit 3
MKYTALSFIALLAITSCDAPGRPAAERAPVRPSEVSDFRLLYSENCSGCHGANGQGGLTVGIGTPLYLAISDDATVHHVIEEGRPGTAMPAFAQKAGGLLTDAQVDILVSGIRNWAKPAALGNERPPAYTASEPGDTTRGQDVFKTLCFSCHDPNGRAARAITDRSYLNLVSDQHLRTVIITGMPHLGMPDWRSHSKPLSDADVTDVVTWLAAQRESLSAQLRH